MRTRATFGGWWTASESRRNVGPGGERPARLAAFHLRFEVGHCLAVWTGLNVEIHCLRTGNIATLSFFVSGVGATPCSNWPDIQNMPHGLPQSVAV